MAHTIDKAKFNLPQNGRPDRFAKEDQMVETFRRKLREAWVNKETGEMSFKILFANGGPRQTRVKMVIEYDFVDQSTV